MTRGSSPTVARIAAATEAPSKVAADPARLVVTLTVAELRELVRDAAFEATSELAEPAPALLDQAGLARVLCIGISTVGRLRREGMPTIWLGDSPRFELPACLDWLRARGRGQP